MKYIYHHLGLGDHIICNGMVRFLQKKYDEVFVFCKINNLKNVQYMYRDNQNIEIIPISDDLEVEKYIHSKNINENVIRVGFNNLKGYDDTFDREFYSSTNLDFNIRFSHFFYLRDENMENFAYDSLVGQNDKYMFIHGPIDKNKIRNDLPIINNSDKFLIFDLLKILKNAEEIHLMESSIKNMVNSFKFEKPKFFYHQYVRGYNSYHNTFGLNKFIEIN